MADNQHYLPRYAWYQVNVLDSYTITIKQNVTFPERMPFKNFRLNRIQNGRLSATIYFHIADIW